MSKKIDARVLMAQHDERDARWGALIKTDPRRAVRALTIVGFENETIEGDTMWDMPHIIEHLKEASLDTKSEVWRRLVDAGVIDAICFCVINSTGTAVTQEGAPQISQAEVTNIAKEQMYSAWFESFQIICNAVLRCREDVTATESRVVEDLKKNWSKMVHRVWTEPMFSLDPDQKGAVERTMLTQVAIRLVVLDPSFLGEFLKPSDLTFAVSLRSWLYATTRIDSRFNAGFLLQFLNEARTPQHWRQYLRSHPLPPIRLLLTRIVLGASKEMRPKPKKRSPQQAAEAIISAAARHIELPDATLDDQALQLQFLRALFIPSKTDYVALPRAMFMSAKIWVAAAKVLRRAAQDGTEEAQEVYLDAMDAFSGSMYPLRRESPEVANSMVAHWCTCGLFKVLNDTVDFIIKIRGAPMTLTLILQTINDALPNLSPNTRSLLRSQLSTTGRLGSVLISSAINADPQEQILQQATFMARMDVTGKLDPSSPVWRQAAWEMLEAATEGVRE